jgi:predicted nucleic acid-binding protein
MKSNMLAYFDTNVFDNLIKKQNGVTAADEARLRAAVSSGQLRIVIGHLNIREILAALPASREIVGPELSLVLNLANWDCFVRFHSTILEADIRHFAYNGERANTAFEDERTVESIRAGIRRVVDGPEGERGLEAVNSENREEKRRFLEGVRRAQAETAEAVRDLREKNEIPTFREYYEISAEEYALAFAQSFDVAEECKRRGLNNLLKISSIHAMVGVGLSFIYRTAVEEKSPKPSDSRDIQHAVCAAAAADVFVTHDDDLSLLLSRVPIKGLRVMRLHELLEEAV